MLGVRQLHDHLKGQRELDLSDMKSYISVGMDYSDYLESLANELGADWEDIMNVLMELEAVEKVYLNMAEYDDTHVVSIEVCD